MKTPRRIVLGLDGSAPARRAVEFVARLAPARGGHVRCVTVLEPTPVPSMPLLPAALRAVVVGQARALDRARATRARRSLRAAVARLRRAGWGASEEIRWGVPLAGLSQLSGSLGFDYARTMGDGELALHWVTNSRDGYNSDTSGSQYTRIDGFSVTNASVGYRFGRGWEVDVFARNLFDEEYFPNANNNTNITPGSPRVLRVAMAVGF